MTPSHQDMESLIRDVNEAFDYGVCMEIRKIHARMEKLKALFPKALKDATETKIRSEMEELIRYVQYFKAQWAKMLSLYKENIPEEFFPYMARYVVDKRHHNGKLMRQMIEKRAKLMWATISKLENTYYKGTEDLEWESDEEEVEDEADDEGEGEASEDDSEEMETDEDDDEDREEDDDEEEEDEDEQPDSGEEGGMLFSIPLFLPAFHILVLFD